MNKQDEVIGQIVRSEAHRKKMHNLRVINAFIKNDRGQLWIPRRVASKRICPLALDMSVGGYVSSWETYNQALFREAVEEVNIDLNIVPYRFLIKLTPQDDDMYAFEQVYEINSNEDPDYNKKDFLEAFWMFSQEVMQKIEQGDSAKSDLPKLLRKIYKVWN